MSNNISNNLVSTIIKTLDFKCTKKAHHLHEPYIEKKDIKEIEKCINKGFVSSVGEQIIAFKNKLKKFTKSKYVVLTSSGSSALHIILKALGTNNTNEVLIPNFNYIASVNAVLMCNANPHFIDIEEKTLGVDVEKLDKYLKQNTYKNSKGCFNKRSKKKINSCIALHTYGYSCDIYKLKKVLNKYKIILIEDAAESIGSFNKKKHLGTIGYAGVISFNGNKTITTGGGGAILTANKKFSSFCSHLSTTAKVKHKYLFSHDQLGYNYRLPNINAALGVSQMNKIKKILISKKKLHIKYLQSFKNNKFAEIFNDKKNCESNHWLNILILKEKYLNQKEKLIKNCIKKNIFVRPGWKLMHAHEYLKEFPRMNLSGSISLYKRLICMPSSPFYFIKNEKKNFNN